MSPLPEHPQQGQVGALHRADDVAQVEAHDLADAGAGAVEDLEQGPVAQDRRAGADDRAEQQLRLLLAQRLGQQVRDGDGRQVERGVVAAQPFFDQEAVEAADARERPGHRRGAVGPAQPLQVRRHVGRRRRVDARGRGRDVFLVRRQVAPVGGQRARGASPLHLEPGEELLGVPGQRSPVTGAGPSSRRRWRAR